jgi:hypothetical protein
MQKYCRVFISETQSALNTPPDQPTGCYSNWPDIIGWAHELHSQGQYATSHVTRDEINQDDLRVHEENYRGHFLN